MEMKKVLALIILGIALLGMVAFAGCISTDTTRVEGTIYNNAEYKIDVHIKNDATGAIGRHGLSANNSCLITLEVGEYTVSAYYWDDDSLIGKDTLLVRASDSTFSIIVNDNTVYCYPY